MSTVFQLLHGDQSLPVSQAGDGGIRRRLSSISLNLKIQPSYSAFRRSKSLSEFSIGKWWGWDWILNRKPAFAADLEMNEDEVAAVGSHNRGSWRHVLYKFASRIRRRLLGSDNVGLPQTFRYDSVGYNKNFDDGNR